MPAIADITKIEAPSEASQGEQIIVDVSIKNITKIDQTLAVTAIFDSTDIPFQFDYLLVAPGQTVVMRGTFIMPTKNVKITAWGWYWDFTKWVLDDTLTKNIALYVLAPEFAGFGITQYNKV